MLIYVYRYYIIYFYKMRFSQLPLNRLGCQQIPIRSTLNFQRWFLKLPCVSNIKNLKNQYILAVQFVCSLYTGFLNRPPFSRLEMDIWQFAFLICTREYKLPCYFFFEIVFDTYLFFPQNWSYKRQSNFNLK